MLKYKVGDKVRIVSEKIGSGWNYDGLMDEWLGKVMTINHTYSCGDSYKMVEDDNAWYWFENMIEGLAEESKEPEDWTESEIQQARLLTTNLLTEIIYNGGDVCFTHNMDDDDRKCIFCRIYKQSFIYDDSFCGESICYKPDVYNTWIGKCVAVCKALKHPIPDFIINKNK